MSGAVVLGRKRKSGEDRVSGLEKGTLKLHNQERL